MVISSTCQADTPGRNELPMAELINPHTGRAMPSVAEEAKKYKIHEIEIPFPVDDAEKLQKGCAAPVQLLQTPEGHHLAAFGPGFDTSAAIVFLETARALEAVRSRLDDLEMANKDLKHALKQRETEIEKLQGRLSTEVDQLERTLESKADA